MDYALIWQVVLLGSAPDPRIQNDFVNLANQLHSTHNDRARLCLSYDEPLSHLVFFFISIYYYLLSFIFIIFSSLFSLFETEAEIIINILF